MFLIFGFLVKLSLSLTASLLTEEIQGTCAFTSQVLTLGTGCNDCLSAEGFQGPPCPQTSLLLEPVLQCNVAKCVSCWG